MPGRILVGTTSWSEKTLVEESDFYPGDVKTPVARLRYYAGRFPVTEVDSTYYGMLRERNAQLWAERTPDGFVFDVKAFRLFTFHKTPLRALPADLREALGEVKKPSVYYRDVPEEIRRELWHRFRTALEPLRGAGKLGAVVFQFAPWFVFRREHVAHVERCAEMMAGLRVAVEMRNKSWFDEKHRASALAIERQHGLTNVVVDEPQGFGSSIPSVWEVTTPELAIVRLHGRNAQTWEAKELPSAAVRFEYRYGEHELAALAPPVRTLADRAEQVHVLFNNCYRDYAQIDAEALRVIMSV
jgi:uncharacterized protein YecE (DUF72 family)